MIEVNVNNIVRVKLTDEALAKWTAENSHRLYKPDKNGWVRMPLWKFMYFYRDCKCAYGGKPITVNNSIFLEPNEY